MAISRKDRERAAALAAELLEITGGRFKENGKSKTFVEIEQEAYDIGDIITSALINQTAAQDPDTPPPPVRCPQCKREPGACDEQDEPIILELERGEAEFNSRGYHCRHCRRSFFPDAR